MNRLSSEAVRFGSFADISQCNLYVRFYLQERTLAVHQRMSRPRADISDMSGWEAIEDESYALPCRGRTSNEISLPPALPASHKYHYHLVP